MLFVQFLYCGSTLPVSEELEVEVGAGPVTLALPTVQCSTGRPHKDDEGEGSLDEEGGGMLDSFAKFFLCLLPVMCWAKHFIPSCQVIPHILQDPSALKLF